MQYQESLNILSRFIKLELTVSEFYKVCGDFSKTEGKFWLDLALAEVEHSKNILEIIDLYSKNPKNFIVRRSFKRSAISTVISGIENNILKIRSGELKSENFLFIARDIEHSLLESSFAEFLTSDDPAFQHLVNEVIEQTTRHREMLEDKIQRCQKK